MSLFGGGKRRNVGSAWANAGSGTMTNEQMQEMIVKTAQMVSIHDVRLRELAATIPQVRIPLGTIYAKQIAKVDAEWKGRLTEYQKARSAGGSPDSIGSKHLLMTMEVVKVMWEDTALKDTIKEKLKTLFQGDSVTEDDLARHVSIMKWRVERSGKNGILEFKFQDSLRDVEAELVRLLEHHSGTLLVGMAPKSQRARELDEVLEGTWRQ